MPQVVPFLPAIIGAGGAVAGAIGGQDQVNPQQLPPMWPDLSYAMGRWMSNQFDSSSGQPVPYGLAPYPGQLSPNMNSTILPSVYGNWGPWLSGAQYQADMIHNRNPVGTPDPRLAQIQQWGGAGGPGNNMMSLMAQYGAPSQAGQYVANTAQFGAPTQAMANLLQPFVTGQGGPRYQAPPIPSRQVVRRGG